MDVAPEEIVTETGDAIEMETEEPVNGYVYIVQSGDSFSSIAHRFTVTVRQIIEANGGFDPARLQVGEKLLIPANVR